jgi:RHS repeat-associated protein
VITAAYDGLQRLIAAREQPGTFFRYSYDLAGNRTGVWQDGTQTAALTYNAADQVEGWQYDAAGNLLSDGSHQWTYDALGRMTGVQMSGEQGSYTYNGDGVLVRAQGSWGQNERYAVDLAAPLSQVLQVQYPMGSTTAHYGQGRLGLQESGATTWLLSDALGSVRQTADSGGTPGWGVWYDPWGQVEQGSVPTFGFAGEQHNTFTGQVYLRARWYSSQQGRFLSWRWAEDESDDLIPYSHHGYAYALSDPLLLDDPTGECPWCIGAVVGGLIGAGIAYGSQVVNNVNQHGLNGAAFTNVDGRAVLGGAIVGAVGGATFGLGLSAGTAVAAAAGLTSASGTAASAVGVATVAVSSVAAGQASRATANAWEGQPVARGLFQPKDMLIDAALGVAGFKVFGGKFNKIAPPPQPHAVTNPPRSFGEKIDDWWTSWRRYRKIRFCLTIR